METIYSRTDGWPSFACWQVACCQHFRLLSYREQQFRILIGTQKDILYSFSWAFTGTGRDAKESGGEERKLMSTCDSNAKTVSSCTLISVYKSLDENSKMERLKEVKRVLLPRHEVLPGSSYPHTSASCCSNNKQFIKRCRRHWVSSYAEHLEEICENWEVSDWNFFHSDSDVHYIEQEAAEITFSEAAKLWLLTKYLS